MLSGMLMFYHWKPCVPGNPLVPGKQGQVVTIAYSLSSCLIRRAVCSHVPLGTQSTLCCWFLALSIVRQKYATGLRCPLHTCSFCLEAHLILSLVLMFSNFSSQLFLSMECAFSLCRLNFSSFQVFVLVLNLWIFSPVSLYFFLIAKNSSNVCVFSVYLSVLPFEWIP